MPELNREDIIKALECCKSPKLTKCNGCPREEEDGLCMHRLNEDALTLIKLLTEENERLKEKADRHLDNLKAVLEERAEANTDVAREIFEEIEKSIMSPDQSQNYKEWYFAELKKKYIGE